LSSPKGRKPLLARPLPHSGSQVTPKSAKPQAAATPAPKAAVAANGKGAKAIPLADILAVKALVERLGAAPLRMLIEAFAK
jgi:hypothetical protein